MSRKYQPIWERVKKDGKCSITAPVPLHKRIIKAVIKEKWLDLGRKVELSEVSKTEELRYSVSGSVITFSIKQSIGLDSL